MTAHGYLTAPVHKTRGRHAQEFSDSWFANNEGFKDIDFVLPKSKLRIMVLGDSYTEGVGADYDSSFPRQLAHMLEDSFSRKTEVWNCGISGSDPFDEFRIFNDRFLKYDPDMAIITFNSTDIHDVLYRGGFERFRPDSTVRFRTGPWFEPLYAHSFLVRRLVHDFFNYNMQFIPNDEVGQAERDCIPVLTTAIDSFTRVCHEKNIKILFVFLPDRAEISDSSVYHMRPLADDCRRQQIPYVNIGDHLIKSKWSSSDIANLYWPIDGHCKNSGYHYFAQTVWKQVAEELDK